MKSVRKKKMENKGVSPVIAVILMVAITVVLAGVLFVWVTTFIQDDPEITVLHLSVKDAATGSDYLATGNATRFEANEPILRLEQVEGDSIDWQKYTLRLSEVDSDMSFDCEIMSIQGQTYTKGMKSNVGDVILVHCIDPASQFEEEDSVILKIYGESKTVFSGSQVRIQ